MVDRNKGNFYSLARIAVEEGGGSSGMRAACNYAMRALTLGPPWIEYDEWTQQVKFLYMVKGYDEEFRRAWSTTQSWGDGPMAAPALTTSSTPASLTTGPSTPAKRDTPALANTAACGGTPVASSPAELGDDGTKRVREDDKSDNKPPAKKPKAASELSKAMSQAKKTKQDYTNVSSQAATIMNSIMQDEKWQWASHDSICGQLKAAKGALEDAINKSPFLKDALTRELGDLKTTYKAAELQTELKRFKETLEPLVVSLGTQCRVLVAQHKARLAAA